MYACIATKSGSYTIKQGVSGKVSWLQGNVMPSPDLPSTGAGKPIKRIIKIYRQTNLNQVIGESPLFNFVNTKLVKTVKTDESGFYQAKLLPGKYSIFTVEEGDQLFANSFNSEGLITTFEVKLNEVVNFNIMINYKAFY